MLPVPVSPFLLTAGATRYPRRKFLAALALGRAAKFLALSFFAATYGRRAAVRTLDHYGTIILWGIGIALIVGVTIAACWRIRDGQDATKTDNDTAVAGIEQIGA
jgi:membrane protein DedA with SNARE-associated domain